MTNESIKAYKQLLYKLRMDIFTKSVDVQMLLDVQSPFGDFIKMSSQDEMEEIEKITTGILFEDKEPVTIKKAYASVEIGKDYTSAFSSLVGENKEYTTSTKEWLRLCIFYNSKTFALKNRGEKPINEIVEEEIERRGISRLG